MLVDELKQIELLAAVEIDTSKYSKDPGLL
jgi:hypothetical protein